MNKKPAKKAGASRTSKKPVQRPPRSAVRRSPWASDRFLKATLDGLSAHVAIVNRKGQIEAVNVAWRRFSKANGVATSRVCEGANYLKVCDDAQGDDRQSAGVFAQAIREVLAGRRDHFEAEYPCHSPQEQRWFIGRVSRMPGIAPGRVLVVHENITARRKAEMALLASEQRLQLAMDAAQEAWWDWNPQTDDASTSSRYYTLLGYAPGELPPRFSNWASLLHPEERQRVLAKVESHYADSDEPLELKYRMRAKSGEWRWILDRARVVQRDCHWPMEIARN